MSEHLTLTIICGPDREPRTVIITRGGAGETYLVADCSHIGAGYERMELAVPETPETQKLALEDARRGFGSKIRFPDGNEGPDDSVSRRNANMVARADSRLPPSPAGGVELPAAGCATLPPR